MTSEAKWLKVTTTDYYGAWETLGQKPSDAEFRNPREKAGTVLEVRWPDGTITKEKLAVEHGHDSAQIDMNNHPDHFGTQTLYVHRTVNGLRQKIRLKDLRFRLAAGR